MTYIAYVGDSWRGTLVHLVIAYGHQDESDNFSSLGVQVN